MRNFTRSQCERNVNAKIDTEKERGEKRRERVIIGSSTSLQPLFTIYSCKSLIAPDGDRWIDDIGCVEGRSERRGEGARARSRAPPFYDRTSTKKKKIKGFVATSCSF